MPARDVPRQWAIPHREPPLRVRGGHPPSVSVVLTKAGLALPQAPGPAQGRWQAARSPHPCTRAPGAPSFPVQRRMILD